MTPDPADYGKKRSSAVVNVVAVALLAAGTALSCYAFLAPGHPVTVDAWPHLSRMRLVYEALRDGHSPFWSFMFYSGYPALRFYSPLLYFAGGAIALATRGDILLALRMLLVTFQALSVAAMFLLVRRRTGDIQASSLAALVYVVVPWRADFVGVWANYSQAAFYLWLPLMFLLLDRLVDRRRPRDALLLGLLVALSLLSHLIYAAVAIAFLGLLLLLGYPRQAPRDGRRTSVGTLLLLAALVALALSAFLIIPLTAEYHGHAFPLHTLSFAVPDLGGLLGLPGQNRGGYIGLGVLALLVLALAFIWRGKGSRYTRAIGVCLAVSLLWVFGLPRLGDLGTVLLVNLPSERLMMFSLFFAALLIGIAWTRWRSRVGLLRRAPVLAIALPAVVIILESVAGNWVNPNLPPRLFLRARLDIYPRIEQEAHAKVLDLTVLRQRTDDFMRTESYPAMGYIFGNLPTPLGSFYHQFAPRSMLYCYPWIRAVATDLGDTTTRTITERTRKALWLMGVSHVLMCPNQLPAATEQDSAAPQLLLKDGIGWDDSLGRSSGPPYLVYGATGADLALASSRLLPMPSERVAPAQTLSIAEDWQAVLDSIELDCEARQLSCIPVTEEASPESLPGSPRLRILGTSIRNDAVLVRLEASSECFLRLAVSYYPELLVTLDGKSVSFGETKDHFIHLHLPAGEHTVRVTAPLTPIRRWTLVASALAGFLVLIVLVLPDRRRRR